MADDELRRLERAHEADPADVAAAWAFAKALERVDDRRAFHVICGIARTGDETARRHVQSVSPWPQWNGNGATRRTERPLLEGPVRMRQVSITTATQLRTVNDRMAIVADGLGLLAMDLVKLEKLWRIEPDAGSYDVALTGDDVVHMEGEAMVRRESSSGRETARVALGGLGEDLAVEGDRAIAMVRGPVSRDMVVYDVGARFGKTIWKSPYVTDLVRFPTLLLAAPLAYVNEDGRIIAMTIEHGKCPWTVDGPDIVAADPSGLVIKAGRTFREVDRHGKTRFTTTVEGDVAAFALGERAFVLGVRRERFELELLAFDRETGDPLPVPELPASAGDRILVAMALGRDALYVLTMNPANEHFEVFAFDGACRLAWQHELAFETARGFELRDAALVPLAGALLVVVRSRALHLVRFEPE